MALIKCTQCGHMVSDRGTKCPKCGMTIHKEGESAENAQNADRKGAGTKKKYIVAALCCIALVVFGVSFWYIKANQENAMKFKDFEITKEFAEAVRRYDNIGSFQEGLASVKKDGKYGFINTRGKEVISCKYDGVGDFHEGLAKVRIGDYRDGKYGLINTQGEEVVPCKYDAAYDFSEGLAVVKRNGKWGYVDKYGNSTFTEDDF